MNNTAVKAAQEAVQRSEELDIRLGLFLLSTHTKVCPISLNISSVYFWPL
jgi:hypothetical protein